MRLAVIPALWVALLSADPGALSTGALTIQSQPGVEVIWEGTPLGETNDRGTLLIEGIPPGDYQLELSKPGFGTLRRQITITPDARTTYGGYLEPRTQSRARSAIDPASTPAPAAVEPEPALTIPEDVALAPPPAAAADSPPGDEPMGSEPLEPVGAATPAAEAQSAEAQSAEAQSAGVQSADAQSAEAQFAEIRSTKDGSTRKQALMALGLAVLGGLAIFLTSRRSKSIRTRDLSTAPELRVEKTVSAVTEENRFIENLQERERALRGAAGDGEVVQVEIIDVREIEGEA